MVTKSVGNRKITFGTREWSDYSVNCINGCSNNCRYCYAKKMALRFGRKSEQTWPIMEIRNHDVIKQYRKRMGRFMFPTAHDITEDKQVLESCLKVIENIICSGNQLLITTKPRINVIKQICEQFSNKKDLIQFRFTITSNDDDLIEFWEPGAPRYQERFSSLKFAHNKGFKTSISIEPFLCNPVEFYDELSRFTTESIWIGPMNYIQRNKLSKRDSIFYENVRNLISLPSLKTIYSELKNKPYVRFKDAFLYHIA